MIIENKTPVVVAPVAEETYDALWLHEIHILTPPTGPGHARVVFTPWQAGTTKTSGTPQHFTIDDLLGKLQADPDFQEAWEKVTSVIGKYMAEADVAAEPD